MNKDVLLAQFEIWWKEEGKFLAPSGDYLAIKELCKITWLASVYNK